MKKILPLLLLFVSIFSYGQVDSTLFFPKWDSNQETIISNSKYQEYYKDPKFLCYKINVSGYDFLVICEFSDTLKSIDLVDVKSVQDDVVDIIYNDMQYNLTEIYDKPVEKTKKHTKWVAGDSQIVLYIDKNAIHRRNQIEIRKM